jgi:thymidylate synthase (FAD)
VRRWVPHAWEAFVDYRLDGMALTRLDIEVLRAIMAGPRSHAVARARELGLVAAPGEPLPRSRERDELEHKLEVLGIELPWRE